MLNIDQVRTGQEQRLVSALDAWNEAKRRLENAIAVAEASEREYHVVCLDVRKRLDAVDLVISMAKELGAEVPRGRALNSVENPTPTLSPNASKDIKMGKTEATPANKQSSTGVPQRLAGLLRRSSRPLFPANLRARYASLSILQ